MSENSDNNGKDTPKSDPFVNMIIVTAGMRFQLGQIVITPNAMDRLSPIDGMMALGRHIKGDWGDVPREDWEANDEALENEGRLLSAYRSLDGVKFWIITEWDRSVTTILLPEDY